jgi:phage shock protein E
MKPSKPMDWILPVIIVAVIGGFLFLRMRGGVSTDDARRHLREGALLVDVRSPGEFAAGCVTGAINVPLSDLPDAMTTYCPDKQRVLLLHCASGGRSGMAAVKLRSAGYAHVFNVGSYGAAEKLAGEAAR